MDFVSYLRDQKEKLNSREYVAHLWDELEGNSGEIDINPNAVYDFNNHLPLLIEQFWEIALEKIEESVTLDEIDDELKVYLLVMLYQCITQSHELISYKCVLYASDVYLNLLCTSQSDDFFKSKLYRSVLTTLESSLEATVSDKVTSGLMFKLKTFLAKSKLNVNDLEVTLATLIQIIIIKSKESFERFEPQPRPSSVSFEALTCLKVLLEEETVPSRKFLITTYFFNGLRKHNVSHLTPRGFNLVQVNFRNLLKSLHSKFKEDGYKTFLNAFIHVWKHPDFTFFGEAVCIMNNLREKHYRTLIDVLNKMLLSKNAHKNLFKLSLAIICYPPKHAALEKIKVTNEILLKDILLNCITKKNEISNAAIESFAEILLSPDLDKNYVNEPVKAILNSHNDKNLTVATVLKGLQSLMSKKWTNRSKNKHLFVISVSIMFFSEKDYPEIYRENLELLTEESSPFDLKPFLPLMSETYLQLTNRNFKYSAFQILKIIFKMALHPMTSSTEFVKYLYTAMMYPNVCKGIRVKPELFIDPIISNEFNFTEFFQKCNTLGLIKTEHLTKLLGNLSSMTESNYKLTSAIVHLSQYKELSLIADYINDHFMMICNSKDLNYLFFIYDKIFKNNSAMRLHQNLRYNEIMVCFIKHHLLRQSFRWSCVPNAFALLKTLEEFTNLDEDFARFKEQYDRALVATVQNQGSFLPLLYFSQLVIFGKVLPNEENLKAVTDFLNLCADELHQRSPEFNPKMWIGCLLLHTNIGIIKTSLVETSLDYLKNGLNSSVTAVKLAAINMMFDLCNMVTHNFEDLIRYMFKQLVYGDNVFKKTCLLKIDRLMRDDYLKLNLEQYLVFVSILGDRNVGLSDYLKQLLSEHFFVSNSLVIARFFVPLIIHINAYSKHPDYKLSKTGRHFVDIVKKNVLYRRKMYALLFNSLPIKTRFNLIFILATHILEKMMKGVIKVDEGFWNMIKDSIYIFKLMSSNAIDDESGESYYKKIMGHILKYILQKSEYSEKSLYAEYHKEIMQGTETLLKLLVFNDSDNVQKYISITVFDAIIHWTSFFMPDLVHIIHVERYKSLQNYYLKLEQFYKKNSHNLRYTEECFEHGAYSDDFASSSLGSLFNVAEEYIPEFD